MADPKIKVANGSHAVERPYHDSKTKVNGNSAVSPPVMSPTSSTASAAVKPVQKPSKLRQMLALAQEVVNDTDAITEYEKSIEGRKALEKDLAHKDGEVEKLRAFNKDLMRDLAEVKTQSASQAETLVAAFEQRYKSFDTDKTTVDALQTEVTEAKVKLEAAKVDSKNKQAEVEKLSQKLKDADKNAKAQSREMKELVAESELQRTKMETSAAELATAKAKLANARAELGDDTLHHYDEAGLRKLGLELQALSRKCHNLALEFFNDPEGAKDSVTEIGELKARFPNIPLSTDTTKYAAKLRCAAAEAVIAKILETQIFTPFYLSPDAKAAATALLGIFGDDEQRRSTYRCQVLLSPQARGEEAARIEEDIVRKASTEVRTTLSALVSVEKQAGFYASNTVPGLFRDAMKLWSEVQRARDPINAEKPDLGEMTPPGKYDEYDQTPSVSPRSPKGTPAVAGGGQVGKPKGAFPAAVLFPQVVTREDIIFNGMVLWNYQTEAPPAAPAPTTPAAKNNSTNVKSMPPIVANNIDSNGSNGGGGNRRHQRRRSVVAEDGSFKGKQNGHGTNGSGGASVVANGN
ncbi:hypothetical protein LIA77_02025 [Sarocladium implicatum]|nr:hypothetical protein LIA77_02025 [Sarocladium implicatum]